MQNGENLENAKWSYAKKELCKVELCKMIF